LLTFDLRPLGASLVIFTPFYRTETGKFSEGYEVSQSLKSRCVVVEPIISSQIFSKVPIQLTARWQFCKTTQLPVF